MVKWPLSNPDTSITWPYREIKLRRSTSFLIGSRARARLTYCNQGWVVRKPVNADTAANPGLKVNQSLIFSCINFYFTTYVMCSLRLSKLRGQNSRNRKPHREVKLVRQSQMVQNEIDSCGMVVKQPGLYFLLYFQNIWTDRNLGKTHNLCFHMCKKILRVSSFVSEIKRVENYFDFENLAHVIQHGLRGLIVKNTEGKSTEANNVSHILYKWDCCVNNY